MPSTPRGRKYYGLAHRHVEHLGATGTERSGYCHLLSAACSACEEKICDVDAADQEQSCDCSEQDQERRAVVTHQRLLEGSYHCGERSLLLRRKAGCDRVLQRIDLIICLPDGDTWFEPAQTEVVEVAHRLL